MTCGIALGIPFGVMTDEPLALSRTKAAAVLAVGLCAWLSLSQPAAAGPLGSWPGADAFQMGMTSPLQFWMTFAGQWQKAWTDMMTTWTKAGKSFERGDTRRH